MTSPVELFTILMEIKPLSLSRLNVADVLTGAEPPLELRDFRSVPLPR